MGSYIIYKIINFALLAPFLSPVQTLRLFFPSLQVLASSCLIRAVLSGVTHINCFVSIFSRTRLSFDKHEGLHLRYSTARTAPAWQGLSALFALHSGLSNYGWLMDLSNSHKPPALRTSRSQLTALPLLIPALVLTMVPVPLRSTASQRLAQMMPQP